MRKVPWTSFSELTGELDEARPYQEMHIRGSPGRLSMPRWNSFKERLRKGEVLIGAAIETPEPDIAELMGMFGFDWFWIDMEHAPLEIKEVQTILQAMGRSETAPIVRVPWNDPVYVKRVLDLGAAGVIIPWVNSEAEAKAAVSACMYPPKGIRGCGPRRASWGTEFSEYVERANENVTVIVQLETRKAMKNLGRILSVSDVDGTMIGPADLSASLGFPGHPENPVVQNAIKKILRGHVGSRVAPGIASIPQDARKHIEMGFRLVNVGSDLGFMESAAVETLKGLHEFVKKNG